MTTIIQEKWWRAKAAPTWTNPAELADLIEDYVKAYDNVSFAELSQRLPTAKGDLRMSFDGNLVIWEGVSEDFSRAIDILRMGKRVHAVSASVLVYFADGAALNLPVAKSPPRGGYRRPHWAPVVLRPGPYPA